MIHLSVKIGKNCRFLQGVVIDRGCVLGDNVFLGNYVVLRDNTQVGDNTSISHFATTETGARIGNHVRMGVYSHVTKDTILEDWVFFAFGAYTLNDRYMDYGRHSMPQKLEPPIIRYGARIGGRAIIMPGVEVGREAFISAAALVTKDCKAFGIYMGYPAKLIGEVPLNERL